MATVERRTKRPPAWHRLRDALADIGRGVYPQRAFDRHNLPHSWLEDHRINRRIRSAEANLQTVVVATVFDSATGNGTSVIEGDWTPTHTDDGSRAPTRTRAWSKRDAKSAAWLLERRFPREYGAIATPDVGSQVVEVIKAMTALRASVAGQPPQGLPTTLIARPALPATVEDVHAGAHAREGDGATGETGTPR